MMGMMMGAGGMVGSLGGRPLGGGGMMGGPYSNYRSSAQADDDDDDISAAWMVIPMAVLLVGGLAAVLVLARPRRSGQAAAPLDVLGRRFAAGEISADDYRGRREQIEKGGLA